MIQIEEAKEIHEAFIVQSQIEMAFETEKMKLDLETVKLGVRAVFQDASKGKYFVALEKGEPIACLLTIPEWSDWRNGTVIWIHSVYVKATHRGQGVYKKMDAFLKAKVQADPKLRGLRLYVDKTNLSAQKVYQKLSMSKEHYELYEWMK